MSEEFRLAKKQGGTLLFFEKEKIIFLNNRRKKNSLWYLAVRYFLWHFCQLL